MTDKKGEKMGKYANFYNSVNHDRVYSSESFAEWLEPFFTNGVFNGSFAVTGNGGMSVNVSPGFAYINGRMKKFDGQITLSIQPADGSLDRIDSVIVRRDDTARDFTIMIVKGNTSANPLPPDLTRNASVFDLRLANIRVSSGAIKIEPRFIYDQRMTSDCGYVTGTVHQIDYTEIMTQWNDFMSNFKNSNMADFDAWYQTVKGKMDNDVGTKLTKDVLDIQALDQQQNTRLDSLDAEYTQLKKWTEPATFWIDPKYTSDTEVHTILAQKRGVFRGAPLGTTITPAQKQAIQSGKFTDLWLGDFWQLNGRVYRIVDFDYFLGGNGLRKRHHIVLMPDFGNNEAMYKFNNDRNTGGCYIGSSINTTGYYGYLNVIANDVGASNIAPRYEWLCSQQVDGVAKQSNWYECGICLPSIESIFGGNPFTPAITGGYGFEKTDLQQFSLFKLDPCFRTLEGHDFWLRDTVGTNGIALAVGEGTAFSRWADEEHMIRPVIVIG